MKLLTKEIEAKLPPFRNDGESAEVAQVKFFCPWGSITWYASEAVAVLEDGTEVPLTDPRAASREDVKFFGVVAGDYREYGYFLLSQLDIRGPMGLTIERDLYWSARPLTECN